jgi:hypothetical protein
MVGFVPISRLTATGAGQFVRALGPLIADSGAQQGDWTHSAAGDGICQGVRVASADQAILSMSATRLPVRRREPLAYPQSSVERAVQRRPSVGQRGPWLR